MKASAHLLRYKNQVNKVANRLALVGTRLTAEEEEIKSLCEGSLYEFTKQCWFQLEGRPYIDGWHIQAICEHLEALYRKDITDLLINQPFRTGKSIVCAVVFPAWVWANSPERFLYTSYSHKLSLRDSTNCRRLIQSAWYQKFWGVDVRLQEDAQNLQKFDNTRGGYRICTSLHGTNTGFGGDFIVFDDPNNVKQMDSDTIIEKTNDVFDHVLSNRFTTLADRRRLVIQQRAGTNDVSGYIKEKNDPRWVHLCLPMEFERARRCTTVVLPSTNGKKWTDPRTQEGELLWPKGVNEEDLKHFKEFDFNNDEYRIAGQLQQRPSPASGGSIKESWFQIWRKDWPKFEYVLQSWDTALTAKSTSAHSAATTWGVFKNDGHYNLMLLSVFAGQVEYPELRKMVVRMAYNYLDSYIDDPLEGGRMKRPDLILVEEKASGHILISDLMRANIPVMKFNPTPYGDKKARCRIVSHFIESGMVWLPTEAPNYRKLTEEARLFLECARLFPNPRPGSSTNDIIDTMSQAFIRLRDNGWLFSTNDPQVEPIEDWSSWR
jgi:phage terminase large subunit-like protein